MDKIHLGIPAERTQRIIQVTRTQTAGYETENGEAFISLPALFQQKNAAAPHGIVLKPGKEQEPRAGNSPSAAPDLKTVLLTPRIDRDIEIPEQNIYRLPESLGGPFRYVRGACFSDQSLILILNPEKLVEGAR